MSLNDFLFNTMYVRVSCNQFRIRHIEIQNDLVVESPTHFTTNRLLIGQFLIAQQTLKIGMNKLMKNRRFFTPSPRVVMHPLEMVESGLSEVEERVFREVALGAGAMKAVIWVGPALSDFEVKEKLKAR